MKQMIHSIIQFICNLSIQSVMVCKRVVRSPILSPNFMRTNQEKKKINFEFRVEGRPHNSYVV